MTDKLTIAALAAASVLGCTSDSSGTPKPPVAPSKATAGAASAGSADGWVEGLVHCVPGSQFADCKAALLKQGVQLLPPRARATTEHLWFGLTDPYDTILVDTDSASGGKVVLLKIQSSMKPGKERKQIVDWFNQKLKAEGKDESAPNTGCGADGGGSSWKFAGESGPEVQYAIETHPRLEGAHGMAMDDYFVKAKSEQINVCFFLPKSAKGDYPASPTAAATMSEFLASPLFKDKTHPIKH